MNARKVLRSVRIYRCGFLMVPNESGTQSDLNLIESIARSGKPTAVSPANLRELCVPRDARLAVTFLLAMDKRSLAALPEWLAAGLCGS